jgi:hypothetical protein
MSEGIEMPPGPPGAVIRLRICGADVAVALHDPALVEPARELFRPYEVSPSDGGEAAPAVRTCSSDDGIVVGWGRGDQERVRSGNELVIAIEFALTESLLAACSGHAHLHASGAVVRGGAVLALGAAGAGKSSLAVSWSLAGIPVLGDDIVFVDATSRACPFKRLFKVTPAVLTECGVRPEQTPFWRPESAEAWYDPAEDGGWASPVPVALLAFVRYQPEADTAVRAINRASALRGLLQSLLPGGLSREASFDRLVLLSRRARAYDVTYGSATDAARVLAELAR